LVVGDSLCDHLKARCEGESASGFCFLKVVPAVISDLQNAYVLPDNFKYYVIPLFAVAASAVIK
jgi:hypothetical protein